MNGNYQEVRGKRGFFGKLILWGFWIFQALMLVWLIGYWGTIGEQMDTATSDAAQAGTAIGGTLGTGMIVFFWLAGTVILGVFALLTRGPKEWRSMPAGAPLRSHRAISVSGSPEKYRHALRNSQWSSVVTPSAGSHP